MTQSSEILFDGLPLAGLLDLSWEEVEAWICRDDPIVFKVSDAEVLAQFSHESAVINAQISVVEGGGDGVLIPLLQAIEALSRKHHMRKIIWQVHALNCQTPNPKLQRVLLRFDFKKVEPPKQVGYFEKITSINDSVLRRR